MLETSYCLSENIAIQAIVVPELKLRDVQRQILRTDLVEASDDPALEDAPEPFNRVRVDRADNVLLLGVRDGAVLELTFQKPITVMFVCRDQRHLVRNHRMNELLQRVPVGALDDDLEFCVRGGRCLGG